MVHRWIQRSVRNKQLQEFLKSDYWLRRYCILSGGVFYFEPSCILVLVCRHAILNHCQLICLTLAAQTSQKTGNNIQERTVSNNMRHHVLDLNTCYTLLVLKHCINLLQVPAGKQVPAALVLSPPVVMWSGYQTLEQPV